VKKLWFRPSLTLLSRTGNISAERKRALWVAGITSPVMDDRIKGEIADRKKPSAEVVAVRRYLGLK